MKLPGSFITFEYPARRMVAAGVFYAGLALPLFLGAAYVAPVSLVGAAALFLVGASLALNFYSLTKGHWVAVFSGCVLFGMLTFIAGVCTFVHLGESGNPLVLFGAAAFIHFGLALLTVASLYPWVNALADSLKATPPSKDPGPTR